MGLWGKKARILACKLAANPTSLGTASYPIEGRRDFAESPRDPRAKSKTTVAASSLVWEMRCGYILEEKRSCSSSPYGVIWLRQTVELRGGILPLRTC